MKKIVLVYDDTIEVNDRIKTIIGNKSFGEMVLKREKMYSRIVDIVKETKKDIEIIKISNQSQFEKINSYTKDTTFFHLKSNSAIIDKEQFKIIIEKLEFIKEATSVVSSNKIMGIIYPNKDQYIDFIKEYIATGKTDVVKISNEIQADIFVDLTDYNNLLMYISSGFDARYFNSIMGDSYSVTKRSSDKKKMKKEYTYYWLLPEHMKNWMVMPYNYKEYDESASYTMERMPMTDIAIRWTHGAIDIEEFNRILDKTFYFINSRDVKEINKEDYIKSADKLYLSKVDERIEKLKQLDQYANLQLLIESGTEFSSIDDIITLYKKIYQNLTKEFYKKTKYISVIGHGDLFFANMLYSKEVNLLRLIDPKGALTEEDLWTNPYYDIAKLSHSICGKYDFFNTGDYNIELNKNMKFALKVNFNNEKYVELFKQYLQEYGYDYKMVRLYEASLFLSMLPLHIDNPHKVFGFILNAINILKEIE